MTTARKFIRREYENAALAAARRQRVLYLFWTRRGRKSTTLGSMAFDSMSVAAHRTVIAASASLLVGSELVGMALTAAEQAIRVQQEAAAMRAALQNSADEKGSVNLVAANSETGKVYRNLGDEDYTDLFKSKKLEFRLYFDKTAYSRLLVIAPNPQTARGWGGTVFRDEQQFTSPELERDLQNATDPIIDTDPTFRLIYASNLCGDDRHPGYEMTLPREPMKFEPDPLGHFYLSQTGILVHRVDLADAYAAGHTLFDKKTGQPVTLETALQGMTPTARKCNYMLVHEPSGTAAIDAVCLHTAQQRGVGKCASVYVDSDLDFERALAWLRDHHLRGAATALGFDVATTTGGMSNPSSLTVTQRDGVGFISPLNVLWKTRDPKLARGRIERVVRACESLGIRARRLCIDGSNERYFAEETKQELASLVPVEVIVGGTIVEPLPSGYEEKVNYKTYSGDLYSGEINDNHYTLPPETYFKKDHRAVIKNAGRFECEVDSDGGHGDSFDSGKLAQLALTQGGGGITGEQIRAMEEANRVASYSSAIGSGEDGPLVLTEAEL